MLYSPHLASHRPPLSRHRSAADQDPRRGNPLRHDALASAYGVYAAPAADGKRLEFPLVPGRQAGEGLRAAHRDTLRHVGHAGFPCVGAKSVFNRRRYRFGLFPALGSEAAVHAVCHDLYEFGREFAAPVDELASFVAVFEGPAPADEAGFEAALWQQLQAMHELDRRWFRWDAAVSPDPDDAGFSFSVGGRGLFVVGLHPAASRLARRTPQPTLVFNLHEQFEALRRSGKYAAMRDAIRRRDLALQGSVNPMLDDHGRSSEARQYAGRAVADDWRCPFHARSAGRPDHD